MKRRPPAGKAGDGKIKASPEEMNQAALAKERRAELEEHPLDLGQYAPMPFGKVAVVGRVAVVLVEAGSGRAAR